MLFASKICSIFILFLLILQFTANLSNAIISLTPGWSNVTESNDAYYDDKTNQTWITFTKEITSGNWNSSINDDINEMISFKWRSDVRIDTGQSRRNINFYENHDMIPLKSKPGMNEIKWESVAPFYYDINENYTLNFIYPNSLSGNIWIAFPPGQSTNPTLPRQPSKPELNISSGCILRLGSTLCISARCVDPDNNSISYSWDWGDEAQPDSMSGPSGRNVTGCHSWNQEGTYTINVTASSSNGAKSSTIDLIVQRRMMPSKPELNISSGCILRLGSTLCISARSVDPDNSSISYSWDWGDGAQPDNMSGPSGRNVTGCHSWNQEGTYTINVTASSSNGSNSSKINLSVLAPRPPETPGGECVVYLGKKYTYNAGINCSTPITNANFSFNWCWDGDGPDSRTNAQAEHMWSSQGTKKIRVRALDIQGSPGNWSKELIVDVYNQTHVECGQDLQNAINNSDNYTELILDFSNCDVDMLIISEKNHLALKSLRPDTSITFNPISSNDAIGLLITDSTNINLSGLSVKDATAAFGICIYNSEFCRINECHLDIQNNEIGLLLKYSGYNQFINTTFTVREATDCIGIYIDKSNYTKILCNEFSIISGIDSFCHIAISSPQNGTEVHRTEQEERMPIMIDNCTYAWERNEASIDEYDGGDCRGNSMVKSVGHKELIFY